MSRKATVLSVALALAGMAGAQDAPPSLLEARRGFKTKLTKQERDQAPLEEPPAELFRLVRFPGPAGQLQAYVSAPPGPGKHPAIVWITGGFPPGGAGSFAWEDPDPENDQSAQAYRHAGLIMMYPALRGTAGNPGQQEGFFGEVDDVLAALEALRKAPGVDPARIYLGGHSTGGTLALLVAAATDRFKAVIAFGPVEDPAGYGAEMLPYDPTDEQEARLRAPIRFLGAIRSPTFVIEGSAQPGNLESLRALEKASTSSALRFVPIEGATHFDVLAPVNRAIADKLASLPADGRLELDAPALTRAWKDARTAAREADDLETLAAVRRRGLDIGARRTLVWYLLSRDEAALKRAAAAAQGQSFQPQLEPKRGRDGRPYFELRLRRELIPGDLQALFAASRAVGELARAGDLQYEGWEPAPE